MDVGEPEEKMLLPNDSRLKIRDDAGLLLDPRLYAKSTCNYCGGNGTVTVRRPIKIKGVAARSIKNSLQVLSETCNCVPTRYQRARRKLLEAVELEQAKA